MQFKPFNSHELREVMTDAFAVYERSVQSMDATQTARSQGQGTAFTLVRPIDVVEAAP